MNNLVVYQISNPPNDEVGFYFIASNEFDSHVRVYHSYHEDCIVQLESSVEPGIMAVHDMVIDTTGFTEEEYQKDCWQRRTIRVARMREECFIMDRVKFYFKSHLNLTSHVILDKI